MINNLLLIRNSKKIIIGPQRGRGQETGGRGGGLIKEIKKLEAMGKILTADEKTTRDTSQSVTKTVETT
jgi:hypothetical protein